MIEAEGADEMELIDMASDEAKQVAMRTTGTGTRAAFHVAVKVMGSSAGALVSGAHTLLDAAKAALHEQRTTGKISVRDFGRTITGAREIVDIDDQEVARELTTTLKRYGVTFAIEHGADGTRMFHVQGKDVQVVEHALSVASERVDRQIVQSGIVSKQQPQQELKPQQELNLVVKNNQVHDLGMSVPEPMNMGSDVMDLVPEPPEPVVTEIPRTWSIDTLADAIQGMGTYLSVDFSPAEAIRYAEIHDVQAAGGWQAIGATHENEYGGNSCGTQIAGAVLPCSETITPEKNWNAITFTDIPNTDLTTVLYQFAADGDVSFKCFTDDMGRPGNVLTVRFEIPRSGAAYLRNVASEDRQAVINLLTVKLRDIGIPDHIMERVSALAENIPLQVKEHKVHHVNVIDRDDSIAARPVCNTPQYVVPQRLSPRDETRKKIVKQIEQGVKQKKEELRQLKTRKLNHVPTRSGRAATQEK